MRRKQAPGPAALERLQAARRGFQGQLGAAIQQLASGRGATAAAASVAGAALLLEDVGSGATGGVQSAGRLYEQVPRVPSTLGSAT